MPKSYALVSFYLSAIAEVMQFDPQDYILRTKDWIFEKLNNQWYKQDSSLQFDKLARLREMTDDILSKCRMTDSQKTTLSELYSVAKSVLADRPVDHSFDQSPFYADCMTTRDAYAMSTFKDIQNYFDSAYPGFTSPVCLLKLNQPIWDVIETIEIFARLDEGCLYVLERLNTDTEKFNDTVVSIAELFNSSEVNPNLYIFCNQRARGLFRELGIAKM